MAAEYIALRSLSNHNHFSATIHAVCIKYKNLYFHGKHSYWSVDCIKF